MEQSELLRFVVEALERLEIPYLVTGSIATIFYGEPRFTNDIDIVADLPRSRVGAFVDAFPSEEFYLSAEAARRAVDRHGQFNVIHPASGLKVDFMIPSRDPFDRSRFSRATRVHPAPDYQAFFATPEDVILKKMQFYREGGGEKHLRDIVGVLRISGSEIDRTYIADWAERFGVVDVWRQLVERSEPAP